MWNKFNSNFTTQLWVTGYFHWVLWSWMWEKYLCCHHMVLCILQGQGLGILIPHTLLTTTWVHYQQRPTITWMHYQQLHRYKTNNYMGLLPATTRIHYSNNCMSTLPKTKQVHYKQLHVYTANNYTNNTWVHYQHLH